LAQASNTTEVSPNTWPAPSRAYHTEDQRISPEKVIQVMFILRKQREKEKEEEKAGLEHTFMHPTACD